MIKFGLLRYSDVAGEGNIRFHSSWLVANNTIRLDILQDWIAALTEEYERIRLAEYGNAERTAIANTVANTDAVSGETPTKSTADSLPTKQPS